MPSALTVAGSDSSGGAGIQADLRTFELLGVRGFSAITALTAQHTRGILGVSPVAADFLALQLEAVMMDGRPDAMKTGMLAASSSVETIARFVEQNRIERVVVDPVLVSTSGTPLIDTAGVESIRRLLFPLTTLLTPNLSEAEVLTGLVVCDVSSMESAARQLCAMGVHAALVKGGHLEGDAIDVLFDGSQLRHFRSPRVPAAHTHGTGCVLSAAITARLACGESLVKAVEAGKSVVTRALSREAGEVAERSASPTGRSINE
jgi:hydroxymethylpyrimidine/phosphomethylpyrimidine kinase